MKLQLLKRFLLHFLFWLIIAGINIGFTFFFMPLKMVILSTLFVLFFQATVFYINSQLLFPRYFSLSNNTRFFVVSTALIVFVTLCQTLAEYQHFSRLFMPQHPFNIQQVIMIYMRSFFWLLFIDIVSTLFKMQGRIRKQAEQTQQIIAEKLNTELKLLKAQINPHFIFNALNNIYSLTYMKSPKAPASVLKLSQMLRYVIEECAHEKVTLKSEIEYIESYIAFQQMKSPMEQNIQFDYSQAEQEILIAPMLFIPFIENSFKYSKIEEYADAFIKIKLTTRQDELCFTMTNSIPAAGRHIPGAGTGIENVKKRLEIIFPLKHVLDIREEANKFNVNLTLLLK